VKEEQYLDLIYDLYEMLINHPPVNEIYEDRVKVLRRAYELIGDRTIQYGIPDYET
jgi:hypothetical protein